MPSDADANAAAIAKMRRNIQAVVDAIDKGAADETAAIGDDFVSGIQALITVPVFPRSLPGAAPHRETGRLSGLAPSFEAKPSALRRGVGSPSTGYQADVAKHGPGNYTLSIGSPQKYAKFLEHGTRFMAQRPHVEPVAKVIAATMPGRVEARIAREVASTVARMPRT